MRRSFRHWTPRYIFNRARLRIDQWRRPDAPWLTKQAYEFLAHWLTACDEGLEWGSGRSTLWLAARVRKLTSVEHNAQWHQRISAELKKRNIGNVHYHFAAADCSRHRGLPRYVDAGASLPAKSLDFVLVDGPMRDFCTQAAMSLLKPGGLLIIDNSERFFPHATHAPGRLQTDEPPSELWREVSQELAAWRCLWTSNGVWDTALFTKPAVAAGRYQQPLAA